MPIAGWRPANPGGSAIPGKAFAALVTNLDTSVGDFLANRPTRSNVLSRLGIDCRRAQRTIVEACACRGLDARTVLAVIRAAEELGTGAAAAPTTSVSAWCDRIESTYHAHCRAEIPRLTELLDKAASKHADEFP